MKTFAQGFREEVLILGQRDSRGVGREVTFSDRAAAADFLSPLLSDSYQMQSLRALMSEETPLHRPLFVSDRDVLDELALAVASGLLRVEVRMPPLPSVPNGCEVAATEIPWTPGPEKDISWTEILVFWSEGGQPVPSIRFKIKPPGGSPQDHTTNSDGKIRLDSIKAGDCEVESDNSDAKYANTVVGVLGAPPAAPIATGAKIASGASASYKLIDLRKYKVKTGDTLESVAKRFSTTWQDLAKYNWGTDDPAKVNRHLRWDVGCSKKTKDGKNYIFDDSDDPGIIFVPEKWKLKEKTGRQIVLLVHKVETAQPWLFSM